MEIIDCLCTIYRMVVFMMRYELTFPTATVDKSGFRSIETCNTVGLVIEKLMLIAMLEMTEI